MKTIEKIRKAVFPVAGMGTRFLPATKSTPKEMLPIVDKPLIQYAVEEAVEAGITELIFVTSSAKRTIEDHFDTNYELEQKLEQQGKQQLLELVRGILPKGVSCSYVRQSVALGLGHAVLCAQPIVGEEPFAVLLADDLMDCDNASVTKQLTQVYNELPGCVIAVENVPQAETSKYGIISQQPVSSNLGKIHGIIEKPSPEAAPSTLAVAGRYILSPRVFHHLKEGKRGAGNEIQLTDAIAAMLNELPVYGLEFSGKRYDCGSKLGYLKATVNYGLKHPETAHAFKHFLNEQHTQGESHAIV